MITKPKDRLYFGVVAMQTENTLILGNRLFGELEDSRLKFNAKPKRSLYSNQSLTFNSYIIALDGNRDTILITPKGQADRLQPMDIRTLLGKLKAVYI